MIIIHGIVPSDFVDNINICIFSVEFEEKEQQQKQLEKMVTFLLEAKNPLREFLFSLIFVSPSGFSSIAAMLLQSSLEKKNNEPSFDFFSSLLFI